MNDEIKNFIFTIGEFNSCEFCNKFGFRKNCPVKSFYEKDEEPNEEKINEGFNKCKSYVLNNLKTLL